MTDMNRKIEVLCLDIGHWHVPFTDQMFSHKPLPGETHEQAGYAHQNLADEYGETAQNLREAYRRTRDRSQRKAIRKELNAQYKLHLRHQKMANYHNGVHEAMQNRPSADNQMESIYSPRQEPQAPARPAAPPAQHATDPEEEQLPPEQPAAPQEAPTEAPAPQVEAPPTPKAVPSAPNLAGRANVKPHTARIHWGPRGGPDGESHTDVDISQGAPDASTVREQNRQVQPSATPTEQPATPPQTEAPAPQVEAPQQESPEQAEPVKPLPRPTAAELGMHPESHTDSYAGLHRLGPDNMQKWHNLSPKQHAQFAANYPHSALAAAHYGMGKMPHTDQDTMSGYHQAHAAYADRMVKFHANGAANPNVTPERKQQYLNSQERWNKIGDIHRNVAARFASEQAERAQKREDRQAMLRNQHELGEPTTPVEMNPPDSIADQAAQRAARNKAKGRDWSSTLKAQNAAKRKAMRPLPKPIEKPIGKGKFPSSPPVGT